MKNLKYIIVFIFLTAIFVSCKNDLESSGATTQSIVFTLQGKPVMLIPYDSVFTDPGCTAVVGTSITYPIFSTTMASYFSSNLTTVSTSVPNKYVINYGVGIPYEFVQLSQTRNVFVANTGNLISSLEGLYSSSVSSSNGNSVDNMQYVIIAKDTISNTVVLSDAYGGLYDIGQGDGPSAAAQGSTITYVSIPNNQFTFSSPSSSSVVIDSVRVLPELKTIKLYTTDNSTGFNYGITLNQIKF